MEERLIKAINRINNIDWQRKIDYMDKNSNLILAKEYIRRAASFAQYISQDLKNAFFRAGSIYNDGFTIDIDKLCPVLSNKGGLNHFGICRYYIEWIDLVIKGYPLAVQFEDLYEPIIKLCERRVHMKMHKGDFEIGTDMYIYLGNGICKYISDIPYDISETALEDYDKSKLT